MEIDAYDLLEERGKDDRDDDHHQQRVEHRPHEPQRGMAVAHLDVAHHKLAQQRREPAKALHFFFYVAFVECHDPVFPALSLFLIYLVQFFDKKSQFPIVRRF